MASRNLQLIDTFINKLRCPLTGKLFLEPIIADDGNIYEKDALINILIHNNGIIPNTGNKINNIGNTVWQLKTLIDLILQNYDYIKKELYIKNDIQLPNIIPYNKGLFDIFGNNLDILYRFDKLFIKDFYLRGGEKLDEFFKYNKNIIDKLLSKMQDLNDGIRGNPDNDLNPLNIAIKSGDKDIIMLFIKNGADINKAICTENNWTATHQIIYYNFDIEIIKIFIDKCDNLFQKTKNGNSIMNFIIRYRVDYIEYAINKLNEITISNNIELLSLCNHYTHSNRSKLINLINSKPLKNDVIIPTNCSNGD